MYTINKDTLECETWHIGDVLSSGDVLTQETFDARKAQCLDEGDFAWQDDEDYDEEDEF